MSSLGDRLRPYFKPRPRNAPLPTPAATARPAQAGAVGDPALSRRSEELARELARLTWDLGGLTYEMAIRDHFRVDVLVRKAARLQQVDAELGSLERLARLEQAGAAGDCPACGALYPRGAAFCSQCGKTLMETVNVAPPPSPPPLAHPASVPPPQSAPTSVGPLS